MKIAVIMTAFNRKEKTLHCLRSLGRQIQMPEYDVFLCDDKSTDGTADSVLKEFPNVKIIEGTGNYFWTRGMYHAMKPAVEIGYDYYLMVNDDVDFFDNMWQVVYGTIAGQSSVGVTGCTVSEKSGKLSYSGAKFFREKGSNFVGDKIEPDKNCVQQCDVANWNCFLVDCEVVSRIGLIDQQYEHSFGDFDYSLRMRMAGMPIYLSPEYIGYCENNSYKGTYRDGALAAKTRIKKILAPSGLPIKSWYLFTHRYCGKVAFRNFVVPYIKFGISLIRKKDC